MRLKIFLFFLIAAAILPFLLHSGIAEAAGDKQVVTEEDLSPIAEPDVFWLWGEVVSVDVAKKEIVVSYLDYETDRETQATLSIDDKTTFENAQSLLDIKPLDTVSVDYTQDAKGSNLAKNISVERPEKPEDSEGQQPMPRQQDDAFLKDPRDMAQSVQ